MAEGLIWVFCALGGYALGVATILIGVGIGHGFIKTDISTPISETWPERPKVEEG